MGNNETAMMIGMFGGLIVGAWASDNFGVSFPVGWVVSGFIFYIVGGIVLAAIRGEDNDK